MKAMLFHSLDDGRVHCDLCSHRCVIAPGQCGICHVRENRAGILETLVFGKVIAAHIDPIEKKPLYHFMPGSRSFSIATVGCNFKCRFCQNADIAQMPSDRRGTILGEEWTPTRVVEKAVEENCRSISYTYTEPTVYFEFAYETARIARSRGLSNVFVTNGYMTAETLETIAPFLDAANVDLKAFSDAFYREQCGSKRVHVLETLKKMKLLNILLEVTTLIIPGLNDDPRELEELARFLANDIGPETPWHISRFHPTYRLTDRPVTPVRTLDMARDIGLKAGLQYVYTGNVPGDSGEHTPCPGCGKRLIERWGFQIRKNDVRNGACPSCGTPIHGIGL